MLTVIVLILLAGGAGLAAVLLADTGGSRPATRPSLRPTTRGATAAAPAPAATVERAPIEPPAPPADAPQAPEPIVAPGIRSIQVPEGPARRRGVRRAPSDLTAIEGTWEDVARVGRGRRLSSLLGLVGIVVVLGVGTAIVLGGIAAVAAELLTGSVG